MSVEAAAAHTTALDQKRKTQTDMFGCVLAKNENSHCLNTRSVVGLCLLTSASVCRTVNASPLLRAEASGAVWDEGKVTGFIFAYLTCRFIFIIRSAFCRRHLTRSYKNRELYLE